MARPQQQGQKPPKAPEPVAVVEPVESPYRHYVPGERPRTDKAYFELLLVKVVRVPGELPEFDEVWPRAVQALAGVNLLRLSTYGAGDVREAITTVGGEFTVRMGGQSEAIVRWAQSFWRIRQIYGTFRQYLRSFETDGFEALMEDLKIRLPGLSPELLTAFLRDAGEKVPAPEKPQGGRSSQQQRQSAQSESRGSDQQRRQQQPGQQQSGQQQSQQQKPEAGRGDRRRRQRGRGGARPAQAEGQATPRAQQPVAAIKQPPVGDVQVSPEDAAKSPQQQQRRRNRRRFFRRRKSGAGGDNAGSATPAEG